MPNNLQIEGSPPRIRHAPPCRHRHPTAPTPSIPPNLLPAPCHGAPPHLPGLLKPRPHRIRRRQAWIHRSRPSPPPPSLCTAVGSGPPRQAPQHFFPTGRHNQLALPPTPGRDTATYPRHARPSPSGRWQPRSAVHRIVDVASPPPSVQFASASAALRPQIRPSPSIPAPRVPVQVRMRSSIAATQVGENLCLYGPRPHRRELGGLAGSRGGAAQAAQADTSFFSSNQASG